MKKRLNNPVFVFTLLQLCSILALLGGAGAISLALTVSITAHTPWFILECLLWITAWTDFFLMCRRLRTETSAFTEKNARTLLVISCCCAVIGLLQFLPWVYDLMNILLLGPLTIMLALLPPVAFLGVAAVGITLRALLLQAMALQAESELTI